MGLLDGLLPPNVERLRERGDVDGLLRALAHQRAEVRASAVAALAAIGDEQAAAALVDVLADRDEQVAGAARTGLRGLGTTAIGALGEALGHQEPSVVNHAMEVLKEIGPSPETALLEVLKGGKGAAREHAAHGLEQLVPTLATERSREVVVRGLLAALADKQPAARTAVATALGKLADPRSAKALVAQLRDGDAGTRAACAEALKRIGPPAAPHLVDALANKNPNARTGAARLLATLGVATEEVAEGLRGALGDREAEVQTLAREALRTLGLPLERPPVEPTEP
jgi:HEAT repeat protein